MSYPRGLGGTTTGTRTEVRSPTSTRTEVRSPTRTATWANTRGNFTATVTGGAGAGATNVTINLPGRRAMAYAQPSGAALGCSCCPQPGLGAVPVLSFALASVQNAIGGIFSSSDRVKDAERKLRVDQHYAGAMAGDAGSLACLMSDAELGPQTAGCIVGSKVAVVYAKAKYAEYQARSAAGPIGTGLVQVGGGLIQQSTIPTNIAATIQKAMSNPLIIGGVVLGAFLLLRKKR